MKRRRRAALGVAALVVVAVAVGLGVFLSSGSQVGVVAVTVGVPAVLIVGVGLYVRSTVGGSNTSESTYLKQVRRRTGDEMRAFWTTYAELRDRFPDWEPERVESSIQQTTDDLAAQGIAFDTDSGTFQLSGGSGDVQEIERLETTIDELVDERDDAFADFVRRELEALERLLDRLDAQEPTSWRGPSAVEEVPAGERPEGLADLLETHRHSTADAVEAAKRDLADALETGRGDADIDESRVREAIADCESALERDRHEAAVEAVLEGRSELEAEMEVHLDADRESIETFAETVQSSVATEYVPYETVETVEAVERVVADLDSALDIDELRTQEDRLREACVEMVETMAGDLDEDLETLADADLPADYYTRPAVADETYATELRRASSLAAFRQTWLNAVGELAGVLDEYDRKAAVADAYPDVEPRIEEELRRSGVAAAADLPVSSPGPFFELYAGRHPDVEYDAAGGVLRLEDAQEAYALTVLARFESGGPDKRVEVAVDGERYEERRAETTPLATEFRFDGVPYGEYEVTATSDAGDFEDASRTVRVEADDEVELVLPEVGLRDSACDGVEDEVRDVLPEVSDRLERTYQDEEFLSSSMSFPIAEEYVPCLLVLWAENREKDVTMSDGDLLVYDGSRLGRRLETIVEHNLDAGESIGYDAIRSRFLSVPASDDLIKEAIRSSEMSENAVLKPNELEKADNVTES